MIVDNPINEDNRIQSLQMRFNSIVKENKLIIQATCQGDNSQYTGKFIQNAHLSFNQILQHLEDRTFGILSKNQDFLKLKIMHQQVELYSISKLQINQLKEATKALNQRQDEFRLMIHSHIDQINKIKYEIKKLEINELKVIVKKSIQRQQQFYMVDMSQNDSIQDVKYQIRNFKLQIKKTAEQIKKINENSLKSEMIKITAQFNEIKNQTNKSIEAMSNDWKSKLNDQQKKSVKNSGDIEKIMKEIEKLSSLLGVKVQNKLVQENRKYQKIKQFKKEQQKSQKFIKQPQQKYHLIKYKWSQQLKSFAITINGNIAKKTKKTNYGQFFLLNASFSNTIKSKQSWAIKINKETNYVIRLGVCLKSKTINYNFNNEKINWDTTSHGLYMIGSNGYCFSHSQKEFNNVFKSFVFGVNDVIYVEYDPINKKLRFSKNKREYFEMKIIAPPQNDANHPFVALRGQNDQVELIKP